MAVLDPEDSRAGNGVDSLPLSFQNKVYQRIAENLEGYKYERPDVLLHEGLGKCLEIFVEAAGRRDHPGVQG